MPSQEEIKQQQDLLAAHRRTLAHSLKQQALLGIAQTPPGVVHGIEEAREQIRRVKSVLRGWGVPVEDLPDDGDAPHAGEAHMDAINRLAAQMRSWFETLGYRFERHSVQAGDYFEWIVEVPARRGYD